MCPVFSKHVNDGKLVPCILDPFFESRGCGVQQVVQNSMGMQEFIVEFRTLEALHGAAPG